MTENIILNIDYFTDDEIKQLETLHQAFTKRVASERRREDDTEHRKDDFVIEYELSNDHE